MGIKPPLHSKLEAGGFKTHAGALWGLLEDHGSRARVEGCELRHRSHRPFRKQPVLQRQVTPLLLWLEGFSPLLSPHPFFFPGDTVPSSQGGWSTCHRAEGHSSIPPASRNPATTLSPPCPPTVHLGEAEGVG